MTTPFFVWPGRWGVGNDQYTKILLNMEGAANGTTFTDQARGATSSHTWTANGSAVTSSAQVKFGVTSLSCPTASGSISASDSVDLTLGTSSWAVDFWFWRESGDGTRRFAFGQSDGTGSAPTTSIALELNGSGLLVGQIGSGAVKNLVTGITTVSSTGWNHCAYSRSGNTSYLFLNGALETSVAFSGTINDSSFQFSVGATGAATTILNWNGFIDGFRLSVGTAREYTTSYSVRITPYL